MKSRHKSQQKSKGILGECSTKLGSQVDFKVGLKKVKECR